MLADLVLLGLASATVSVTVGASKLFKPLRVWIALRNGFFGDLIACPYCLGHWVSGILVALYLREAGPVKPATAIVLWLAATAISAIASGLITLLFTVADVDDDE